MRVQRLTPADRDLARRVFTVMVETFEEEPRPLGDAYLVRILSRPDFWALAALNGDEDDHAIEFYRATGGVPSPVTLFTYSVNPGGA